MIISLPKSLPASRLLRNEGLVVVDDDNPILPMLQPLRVALVNLMPDKPQTELQFARLLAQAPHSVQLTLVRPAARVPSHTTAQHFESFYKTIPEVLSDSFDGVIVTGSPVETMEFEEVDYWPELRCLFDWIDACVPRSLFICWGAQAVLHHRHGIAKFDLGQKAFGVFDQVAQRPDLPALQGLGEHFATPVSRHTEVREADICRVEQLDVLASSEQAGLCLIEERQRGALMMFNHLEYDTLSLDKEFRRDRAHGTAIPVPSGYYPNNEAERLPVNRWAAGARRFYSNWINDVAATRSAPALPEQHGIAPFAEVG